VSDVKLSIIIVNWNVKDLVEECIKSVYFQTKKVIFEIIVVDNNSTDGSIEMLEKQFQQIHLIKNNENLGFARANNQAIKRSKGECILLLNPDTVVRDRAIEKMIEFMESHPRAGACGCKLILPNGEPQSGAAGFFPSIVTIFNYYFFLSYIFPSNYFLRGFFLRQAYVGIDPIEVDWVSAASMMVRKKVIGVAGLLNEDYFMYVEDMEWCKRIKEKGWEIYYLPEPSIIHYQSASINYGRKGISTLWLESLDQFYQTQNKVERRYIHLMSSLGFCIRGIIYFFLSVLGRKSFTHRYQSAFAFSKTSFQYFFRKK